MTTSITKDPIAIARRCFEDVMVKIDVAAADEILAPDVMFTTANGEILRGKREFQNFAVQLGEAFPDLRFDLEELFTDGERVAVRFVMRGTFQSTVMGLLPTGEEFAVTGIDTFRVQDGKITEIHASYDTLGQMQQLGVVKL